MVCQTNTTMCYVKQDNTITTLEAIIGMSALVVTFCVIVLIICCIQYCQRRSASSDIFKVHDDQGVYQPAVNDSLGAISNVHSTEMTPIEHLKQGEKKQMMKPKKKDDPDAKSLQTNGS